MAQESRRRQLLRLRRTKGAQFAADVAGIPKRVRVSKPSNASGFGYRTLSKKNRADRLQRLITGYTRSGEERRFATIDEKTVKKQLEFKRKEDSSLAGELAIDAVNAERAQLLDQARRDFERGATTIDDWEIDQELYAPLTEAEEENLLTTSANEEWAEFRAEYDSITAYREAFV